MNTVSSKCILCDIAGRAEVWNSLNVWVCPLCQLAWRATFDLPRDYYDSVPVDDEDIKKMARGRNSSDQVDILEKFLPASEIYDLGCGDGSFLVTLRDRGYKNCVGVEPGEKGSRIAKERGLTVFRGTISDLPRLMIGKNARAVTLFHLIEHLDKPKSALEIIREVLPLAGVLVLETPDAAAPVQRLTDHQNHLVYPEHLFYWNKESLRKLLEQTGFRVMMIRQRSFDWRQAPISRSLFRLGLRRGIAGGGQKVSPEVRSPDSREKPRINWPRSLIRTLLAHLVHLLGRDDYILVVAERIC